MLKFPLAVFSLAFALDAAGAQTMSWVYGPFTDPTALSSSAVVYDTARKEMVFVAYTNGFKVTTWIRRGTNWSSLSPVVTAPLDRAGHKLVYDQARREVVLYGGANLHFPFAMWTWNGVKWTIGKVGPAPGGLLGHAMAYDVARQRTVHFGGGSRWPFVSGDTWEWDGRAWLQRKVSTAPSPRGYHAMVYDSARKGIVLFGGRDSKGVTLADTWSWDGKAWKKHSSTLSPPARSEHSMAFDANRQVVVLFGGLLANSMALYGTWTWNGKNWSKENPRVVPAARYQHAMAYDPLRQETLMIGGRGKGSGTMFWTSVMPASASSFGAACGTAPGVQLTAAHGSLPALGEKFSIEVKGLPTATSAGILSLGLSRTNFGQIKLPLDLTPLGMKGCNLYNSFDVQFVFTTNKGLGTFALPIPYLGTIKGAKVYLQAFGVDRAATKLGLVSSNGLELTFGYR